MLIGIIGPAGAGKATLAAILAKEYGFEAIGTAPDSPSGDSNSSPNGEPHDVGDSSCQTNDADNSGIDLGKFKTCKEIVNYTTPRWRQHFVTCDIYNKQDLETLRKRPFFLLLYVDAPMMLCYKRHNAKYSRNSSLEEFITNRDNTMFGNEESGEALSELSLEADLTVFNAFNTVAHFTQYILSLNLTSMSKLIPSWDTYFMHLADLAAKRANCMKRRVGCILVCDKQIVATGYNGTPRGLRNCHEGGCDRCNQGVGGGEDLHRCLCLHAEENALMEAGRERIRSAKKSTIYCNTCPCIGCAKKIIQAGVIEVVYSRAYAMDEFSARLFAEAGVTLRQHSPVHMRLDMS